MNMGIFRTPEETPAAPAVPGGEFDPPPMVFPPAPSAPFQMGIFRTPEGDPAPVSQDGLEWRPPPHLPIPIPPFLPDLGYKVTPEGDAPTIIDIQISNNADDALHDDTPTFNIASNDGAAGSSATIEFDSWMRFINVNIPNGAIINVAHIRFNPNVARSGTTVRTNVFAEAVDNAARITSNAEYVTAVGNPTTIVAWDGLLAWAVDVEEQSASLVVPMQELVDRSGWNSGNNQNWFWEDNASDPSALRQADSHDGSPSQAPILHVEFTSPPAAAVDVEWRPRPPPVFEIPTIEIRTQMYPVDGGAGPPVPEDDLAWLPPAGIPFPIPPGIVNEAPVTPVGGAGPPITDGLEWSVRYGPPVPIPPFIPPVFSYPPEGGAGPPVLDDSLEWLPRAMPPMEIIVQVDTAFGSMGGLLSDFAAPANGHARRRRSYDKGDPF